jgi:hypothetical protein
VLSALGCWPDEHRSHTPCVPPCPPCTPHTPCAPGSAPARPHTSCNRCGPVCVSHTTHHLPPCPHMNCRYLARKYMIILLTRTAVLVYCSYYVTVYPVSRRNTVATLQCTAGITLQCAFVHLRWRMARGTYTGASS